MSTSVTADEDRLVDEEGFMEVRVRKNKAKPRSTRAAQIRNRHPARVTGPHFGRDDLHIERSQNSEEGSQSVSAQQNNQIQVVESPHEDLDNTSRDAFSECPQSVLHEMAAEMPTLCEVIDSLDASKEKEIQQCHLHLEKAKEAQANTSEADLHSYKTALNAWYNFILLLLYYINYFHNRHEGDYSAVSRAYLRELGAKVHYFLEESEKLRLLTEQESMETLTNVEEVSGGEKSANASPETKATGEPQEEDKTCSTARGGTETTKTKRRRRRRARRNLAKSASNAKLDNEETMMMVSIQDETSSKDEAKLSAEARIACSSADKPPPNHSTSISMDEISRGS